MDTRFLTRTEDTFSMIIIKAHNMEIYQPTEHLLGCVKAQH